MNLRFFLPLVVCVFSVPTHAAPSSARSAIEAAHVRMDAAFSQRDAAAFTAFLASDFVARDRDRPLARAAYRKEIVQNFGGMKAARLASKVQSVAQTGLAAVAVVRSDAVFTFAQTVDGLPNPLRQTIIRRETWTKRAGKWMLTKREDTPLRAELRAMVRVDQDARNAWLADQKNVKLAKRMEDIDVKNTARMTQIVEKYGWPGKNLVGDDGAHDAWLLVQHADRDKPFQKRCLALMEPLVKRGEVSGSDFAYLTDRVLVGEGKLQIYGSQFHTNAQGEMVPQPIADAANVDARRKDVGLTPLAEYAKVLRQMYQPGAH